MPNLTSTLSKHILQDILICPVCGAKLALSENCQSLLCQGAKCHCFDGGGGGYLPLSPRHSGGGDSKEAVRYRTAFLSKGYYRPAALALCELVKKYLPLGGYILDAGCGEGYYSLMMANISPHYHVLGIDLSKFAVDAAAKASKTLLKDTPRTAFAVGSVFDLPVRDASVDCVTNIFAPCAPVSYRRVLKDGGYLLVAGAGANHLMGLKQCIYDDPYLNEGRRDLPTGEEGLALVETFSATFDITVEGGEDLKALFSMTPYYWRTSQAGHERLAEVERIHTPVTFDFFVYQKI